MVDGRDAGAVGVFYLVQADRAGERQTREAVILPDKAEIAVAGALRPIAVELRFPGVDAGCCIDPPDQGQHFFRQVAGRWGVESFEYTIAEEDNGDDGIAGGQGGETDGGDGCGRGAGIGPVDIKVAQIKFVDLIFF